MEKEKRTVGCISHSQARTHMQARQAWRMRRYSSFCFFSSAMHGSQSQSSMVVFSVVSQKLYLAYSDFWRTTREILFCFWHSLSRDTRIVCSTSFYSGIVCVCDNMLIWFISLAVSRQLITAVLPRSKCTQLTLIPSVSGNCMNRAAAAWLTHIERIAAKFHRISHVPLAEYILPSHVEQTHTIITN